MAERAGAVAVLGAGTMGQKLSCLLGQGPRRLWSRSRPASLPAEFAGMQWQASIAAACTDAEAIIVTVPIAALRQVARELGEVARGDQLVFFVARGVEPGFVLPHQILREETCLRQLAVLGGPLQSLPPEPRQPAAIVVGSAYPAPGRWLRQRAGGVPVLLYDSADMVGIEIAGALGHVTSMAVGMAEALGLGDTVRGILLTRGLAEASRLAVAMGGAPETFANLAGIGSLIPQPGWRADPHVRWGEALGRGEALPESSLDGVVTATALGDLGVSLPLMEAVGQVLRGEQTAAAAIEAVLHRGLEGVG